MQGGERRGLSLVNWQVLLSFADILIKFMIASTPSEAQVKFLLFWPPRPELNLLGLLGSVC
jgi:hypothetical protein